MTGTNAGDFNGIPATRRSVETDSLNIGMFKDGRGYLHQVVTEDVKMLTQLGLMPGGAKPRAFRIERARRVIVGGAYREEPQMDLVDVVPFVQIAVLLIARAVGGTLHAGEWQARRAKTVGGSVPRRGRGTDWRCSRCFCCS